MRFAEWLKNSDKPRAEIAEAIGVNRMNLWRIAQGKRTPSAATARRIEQVTGGAVTLADLVPA